MMTIWLICRLHVVHLVLAQAAPRPADHLGLAVLQAARPDVMLRTALPGPTGLPAARSSDVAQHTEFILKSVAKINETMYQDQMVVPEWPSQLEIFM